MGKASTSGYWVLCTALSICNDLVTISQCQGVILDIPGTCSDDPGLFFKYYMDLAQLDCVIHHPDWNFKEILNLVMKIENSINNTCYGYIYPTATLQENVTPTNQDDLYIILTIILRRIWIRNQKFEIPSMAPAINRFVFQPHFGKIWSHQIRPFELIPRLIFQGESGSEVHLSISGQDHVTWLIHSQC